MAVLTSGELAIARATVSASASLAAPSTLTVTSLVEPSPSAAILRASSPQTALMAAEMAGKAAESTPTLSPTGAALPVANRMAVSLVEVSESTVTLLKVCFTA